MDQLVSLDSIMIASKKNSTFISDLILGT